MDGGESGEGMLDVDALSEGSAALGGAAPPPELHEGNRSIADASGCRLESPCGPVVR